MSFQVCVRNPSAKGLYDGGPVGIKEVWWNELYMPMKNFFQNVELKIWPAIGDEGRISCKLHV